MRNYRALASSYFGLVSAIVVASTLGGGPLAARAGANQAPASPSPAPSPIALPLDARSNVDSLVGWASGAGVIAERKLEDAFMAMPSASNAAAIEQHISSVPHRAGTLADKATADFVRERLQSDGFDVNVVPFQVIYTMPTRQVLSIVSPPRVDMDLIEGPPGNHSAAERMAGPSFMENSGDGDVTGPVFYLNKGQPDDWKAFDDLHVAMPAGSIVLVRWGFSRDPHGGARFYEELQKRKVAGFLEYEDASDDGFARGEMWPKGNYKNEYMAERISGPRPSSPSDPPGDPTSPGVAPLPGVAHKSWDEIPHSTIPEINVTQHVARELLARMGGPVVPDGWHAAFEIVQHVGGDERVHMAVKMDRRLVTIWDVFGTLSGATLPDQTVVIGSHRDAMTFGAIDPGSGTTVLLQVADGFAKLVRSGWKPGRTIEIASWDGHELGLWGSISLAFAHGDLLRKHVVQYINTDQLTTGPPFLAAMSAGLWTFGSELASLVRGLDNKPLMAADSAKEPVLEPPGGGSDHMTFIYMLGVPGTTTGYYGHFGAHHTAEDNIAGIQTYDPGFKEAVITAQFTGVQAMRAAGAQTAPLRISEVPALMLRDLDSVAKDPNMQGADFAALRTKLAAFSDAAKTVDAKMLAAERSGDATIMGALAAKVATSRDAFYSPDGLSYNRYWHTIDRFVRPFPEVSYASYETDGRAEKMKAAIDRLTAAVEKATAALQ
jgi:N-acetylated-alpha-linked acidic dipeptidase